MCASSSPVQSPARLVCVVLFDIDGTLLTGPTSGPSAGVEAMAACARTVTGQDGLHRRVEFAGRTDRQIARDMLVAAGAANPSAHELEAFVGRYVEALRARIGQRPYRPLNGVREAVRVLHDHGAIVGLGTGNVRLGAQAKLQSAGLADLFDLDRGGYGDDADTRAEVLRVGVSRCDPTGSLPVIIVGDTPYDVHAALDIGALCVAVPTGMYDAPSLIEAGAHRLVAGLDATLADDLRALLP